MKALSIAIFLGLGMTAWAEEDMASDLREAKQQVEALTKANAKLRDFAMKSLVGKRYDCLETQDGKTYLEASVTSISDDMVEIRYTDGSEQLEAIVSLADGPDEWALLVKPDGDSSSSGAQTREVTRPGEAVSKAIVVIEGDAGDGTGFLAEHNGTLYLYTAAHVISGNQRLEVKLKTGRKITKFGAFEASDGADLVRIEVMEEFHHVLQIAPEDSSKENMTIFAGGNSGGGGTVGFEKGSIKGVGAESIEIDAKVIQGNSGGPILDGTTHEVLGLVTHLIAARKDKWAKETRFSEIRRFGCRVDREWAGRKSQLASSSRMARSSRN